MLPKPSYSSILLVPALLVCIEAVPQIGLGGMPPYGMYGLNYPMMTSSLYNPLYGLSGFGNMGMGLNPLMAGSMYGTNPLMNTMYDAYGGGSVYDGMPDSMFGLGANSMGTLGGSTSMGSMGNIYDYLGMSSAMGTQGYGTTSGSTGISSGNTKSTGNSYGTGSYGKRNYASPSRIGSSCSSCSSGLGGMNSLNNLNPLGGFGGLTPMSSLGSMSSPLNPMFPWSKKS